MTTAAAKGGFLSCLLPHHVDAGATGKVVLQVSRLAPFHRSFPKLTNTSRMVCRITSQ